MEHLARSWAQMHLDEVVLGFASGSLSNCDFSPVLRKRKPDSGAFGFISSIHALLRDLGYCVLNIVAVANTDLCKFNAFDCPTASAELFLWLPPCVQRDIVEEL